MQYKPSLLAFVALTSSLVAAAPQYVPVNVILDFSKDFLPVDTSLLIAPNFVPFPQYQSTNEGHTWPLYQCLDPYFINLPPMLDGFSCTADLLKPWGSNISIVTWDTEKIQIGNSCTESDNKMLPPTWVCMRPNGSNDNTWKPKSHLQRGYGIKKDCKVHNTWSCPWSLKLKEYEVVDENGVHWDVEGGW